MSQLNSVRNGSRIPKAHLSTVIVVIVAAVVLALLNIPGRFVRFFNTEAIDPVKEQLSSHSGFFVDEDPFAFDGHFEHGWPATYLVRKARIAGGDLRSSPWNMSSGVLRWTPAAILLNVLVATMLLLAIAYLFQFRRQRRSQLRRFQFRAFDLLILTAGVAGCGGFIAHHVSRYRGELHVVEANPRHSATWQLGGPTWLRPVLAFPIFDTVIGLDIGADELELEHISQLSGLKMVQVTGPITQQQLDALEQIQQLEVLHLQGNCKPEAGAFRLPKLPNLRYLDLSNTGFRGDGLENLPKIEVLKMNRTKLTDSVGPQLARLHHLRILELARTDIGDNLLKHLVNSDQLREINLGDTNITDNGLSHVAMLPELQTLWLHKTNVGDHGLQFLSELSVLRHLSLGETNVTDVGLRYLASLHSLKALYLSETAISSDGLVHLSELQELQTLDLSGTNISDPGTLHLAPLTQLILLSLKGTSIGDAGLLHLAEMPRLVILVLDETKVTDKSVPVLIRLTKLRLRRTYLYGTAVSQSGKRDLDEASASGGIAQFFGP